MASSSQYNNAFAQLGIQYYPGTNIPIPQPSQYDNTYAVPPPQAPTSVITHPDMFRHQSEGHMHIPKFYGVKDMHYRRDYVTLYSGDRDRDAGETQTNFSWQLSRPFTNVKSIKLVYASYPNTNNVLLEPYLVLRIPNLSTGKTQHSNNTATDGALSLLFPDQTVGGFVHAETTDLQPRDITMRDSNLISRLSNMKINITTVDGTLFDFGTDTAPPTAPNKAIQVTLCFEILYNDAPSSNIGSTPVF